MRMIQLPRSNFEPDHIHIYFVIYIYTWYIRNIADLKDLSLILLIICRSNGNRLICPSCGINIRRKMKVSSSTLITEKGKTQRLQELVQHVVTPNFGSHEIQCRMQWHMNISSFFVKDLGLGLPPKLCPDQSQAFKEVNNSQAYRRKKKNVPIFFRNESFQVLQDTRLHKVAQTFEELTWWVVPRTTRTSYYVWGTPKNRRYTYYYYF